MLRVVLRHVDSADSILVGDFSPSEIRPLLEVLGDARIYWDDDADDAVLWPDGPLQLVRSGVSGADRAVLEILVGG